MAHEGGEEVDHHYTEVEEQPGLQIILRDGL